MRLAAPQHISLPSRVMSLSGTLTGADPTTPSPQTPLPYDPTQELPVASSSTAKREREEETTPEVDWSEEELEVVQSTLRHPFRPLSSPFPPGELPPPALLDEIANQIMAYGLRGSPKDGNSGWIHGWDATRKKVYSAALDASRSAHGIEKEKISRAERVTRPGLRRVDSMDFLDQADEHVGSAIRSSTSLQNSAKARDPHPTTSSSSSSALPPAPAPRRKSSNRVVSIRGARPSSLLQRGRSYTASELQAEDSVSPQSPQFTQAAAPLPLQRPARITRSQSTILASQPQPHAARDSFLHSPSTLDPSFTLDVRTTSPSWSDSEDEEVKPKRNRPIAKKPQTRMRAPAGLSSGSESSLQSPFEEKDSFL